MEKREFVGMTWDVRPKIKQNKVPPEFFGGAFASADKFCTNNVKSCIIFMLSTLSSGKGSVHV